MENQIEIIRATGESIIAANNLVRPQSLKTKARNVLLLLIRAFQKVVDWVINPENWKKKKTWIFALIFLKAAYTFLNEYGLNPLKKSLNGDHVFLTGAGSGIGRLMAIRFGKLGCKLSLSDINMASLEETKSLCEKEGIPHENISIFICDVSKKDSITSAANLAR